MLSPGLALAYGIVLSDLHGYMLKRIRKAKKLTFGIIPGSVLLGVIIILHLFSLFGVVVPRSWSMKKNVAKFRWAQEKVLGDLPRKPVYMTGGWWLNKMAFFMLPDLRYADVTWDRSAEFRNLGDVKEPSELSGSYIVLDRSHFNGDNDLRVRHAYDTFANYVQLPPPDWKLLGSRDYVEIYEVPDNWDYSEPEGQAFTLGAFEHAMAAKDIVDYLLPGTLIVTPGDREDIILAAIAAEGIAGTRVLSGLVLTRNVLPHPKLMAMIAKTRIPVVSCSDESFEVATRIHNMTVKTLATDSDKIPIIKDLITKNIDLDVIRGAFEDSSSLASNI